MPASRKMPWDKIRQRCIHEIRFIRQTSTSGAFHAKNRRHSDVIPEIMSFPRSRNNLISARIKTIFPRRRESSPSAARAIKISPTGTALLYPFLRPCPICDALSAAPDSMLYRHTAHSSVCLPRCTKGLFRHARLPFLDSHLRGNDVVVGLFHL
jgi:hypothetical protein